jgi:hypothetical protein
MKNRRILGAASQMKRRTISTRSGKKIKPSGQRRNASLSLISMTGHGYMSRSGVGENARKLASKSTESTLS